MLKHYEHDWQYLYFAIKDSTIHTRQKPSTGVTSYYHKNSLQSDSIQIRFTKYINKEIMQRSTLLSSWQYIQFKLVVRK